MSSLILQHAETLGRLLLDSGATVTTAESCTAGGVAYAITSVAGSSQWFNAGFVTYSNAMKSAILGVAPALLEERGAVSEAVVKAMLLGALTKAEAQVGVAISGIAGPGGATVGKPVGTVCFAVGSQSHMRAVTCHFKGGRRQVREQSVIKALELLLEFASDRTEASDTV